MKINYSCVVDNKERYLTQGWLWANSLIKLGKVNPANIWVHFVRGIDDEYINKFAKEGINVALIDPYGDKKYCNKIAQMRNDELKDSDAIILMDIDMIVLDNFEDTLDFDYINSKIVNAINPPIEILDELFAMSGLKKVLPDLIVELNQGMTYGANFNGGLYFIPKKYYDAVQSGWEKWSQWLLINGKPLYDAGKEANIDQVSFCMTVHENNIPIKYLTRLHNYPMPFQFGDAERIPYVLHYHTVMEEHKSNLIKVDYEPLGNVKKAVEMANEFITQVEKTK